jgi:predicted nuclease of predicted toxin-antitoxin system
VTSEKDQDHQLIEGQLKFLVDENFPLESVLDLKRKGVDVQSVLDYKKGITDEEVLKLASSKGRILITFDQDFGELAFRQKMSSKGIVLLRIAPASSREITNSLINLLSKGIRVESHFTVIEKNRIRTFPFPSK